MGIEYGGKTYNITIDKGFGKGNAEVTLDDVIGQLNTQFGEIKGKKEDGTEYILFECVKEDGDKIAIKSVGGDAVKLSSASNKLLEVLNLEVGKPSISKEPIGIENLTREVKDIFKDGSITFDLNGVQKTIKFNESITDREELQSYLKIELDKAYGPGKINVEANGDGVKFSTNSNTDLFGVSNISKELSNYTGIENSTYNRISQNKSLNEAGIADLDKDMDEYEIEINGVSVKIDKSESISKIISKINNNAELGVKIAYSPTTDTFTVRSTTTGAHAKVDIKDVTGNLAKSLFGTASADGTGDYKIVDGTDTEMTYTLNGVETTITRSTADFIIDGMNISLNEKAKNSIEADKPVTFTVKSNVDEIAEKVKAFIDEYNEIITLISSKTNERPKSNYLPLTPDQIKEMEKSEIEEWTVEAKKGSIYGDNKMLSVLYNMRDAMIKKTTSSLSLADIGISTGFMDRTGKLNFDEEKFKAMVAEKPDEIEALFSGQGAEGDGLEGIGYKLQSILRDNVGYTGTSGLLIDEAGLDNALTRDKNNISERMKEYDSRLDKLKKAMEVEKERYYKQFSALEQALSKLNAQSGWLTQFMGGE